MPSEADHLAYRAESMAAEADALEASGSQDTGTITNLRRRALETAAEAVRLRAGEQPAPSAPAPPAKP